MPRFVIEREIHGAGQLSQQELHAISQKSCSVLQEMGPRIQWQESFVTGDKIYCVYIAPDEATVRKHATKGGFPANRVSRIATMIELGVGFHPDLSGRENVYLSGSILGMRRREIADKIERIIDFSGVRQFIDVPVKRYSSGMYLRLGFAIAAHLDPDILLLDEVLAVGDAEFQAKCLERINELHGDGRTIVFISHDLAAVEYLCRRVVLMRKGQMVADGPAADVIALYRASAVPHSEADAALEPVP